MGVGRTPDRNGTCVLYEFAELHMFRLGARNVVFVPERTELGHEKLQAMAYIRRRQGIAAVMSVTRHVPEVNTLIRRRESH